MRTHVQLFNLRYLNYKPPQVIATYAAPHYKGIILADPERHVFAVENLGQREEDVFQLFDIRESCLPGKAGIMTFFFGEVVNIAKVFLHLAGDENKKNGDAEDSTPCLNNPLL
jgi:hypothetical protein